MGREGIGAASAAAETSWSDFARSSFALEQTQHAYSWPAASALSDRHRYGDSSKDKSFGLLRSARKLMFNSPFFPCL